MQRQVARCNEALPRPAPGNKDKRERTAAAGKKVTSTMREVLLVAAGLWLATRDGNAAHAKRQDPVGGKLPPLKTTEFPDGTGTIGLAPGWKVDGSYRGSIGCKGPGGAAILVGFRG